MLGVAPSGQGHRLLGPGRDCKERLPHQDPRTFHDKEQQPVRRVIMALSRMCRQSCRERTLGLPPTVAD